MQDSVDELGAAELVVEDTKWLLLEEAEEDGELVEDVGLVIVLVFVRLVVVVPVIDVLVVVVLVAVVVVGLSLVVEPALVIIGPA